MKHVPDELLGRVATLRVRRILAEGALLARESDEERDAVLLPRREVDDAKEGDALEVFIYLDSDDAPIATRARPKVMRDEVAFLTVTDLLPYGAFVDWGLPKELLVPKDEQIRDVLVGERHAIGVYLDDTGRLAGTMRVSEMLKGRGDYRVGDWVDGEAWRKDPELGIFVIVEKRVVGLLPATEPTSLARGEADRFRISHVHRDGKIELSLRALAHQERDNDARKILDVLSRADAPKVSENATPDELRALFGLSKKAFKRAVGGLLREGTVDVDADGAVTLRRRIP
jgi:uncharacterized protein